MKPDIPQYDFSDPVFRTNLQYKCWAREHQALAAMQSNVIRWEVMETVSPLKIPVVYHIHYHFKTIVGVDETLNPVYGNHHILELSIPTQYPLVPCKLYMQSDIWHPNIKSEGRYKGRVCGNVDGFGISYDLYLLVLRVGEILQYKNYHIDDVWPYPEDKDVAAWVRDFAEPHGIVDKSKGIVVDDTPLLLTPLETEEQAPEPDADFRLNTPAPKPEQTAIAEPEPEPDPVSEPKPEPEAGIEGLPETPDSIPEEAGEAPKIKISAVRQNAKPKTKITIRPKD